MQIDTATIFSTIGVVLVVLGAGWRYHLYSERRLAAEAKECMDRIAAAEAKIDAARIECMKRDDLMRIEAAIGEVHKRIDAMFPFVMKALGREA